MAVASRLYQLQVFDSRQARLEATLAALDDGSALRARVEQARLEEEAARIELHDKQARLRTRELELQSTAGKAAKMEQDLYSGRVSNPKELQSMQQEIQMLTRQRERIEEEMLGLMEDIERLLADLRTREAARQAQERALDEHLEEYKKMRQQMTAELESLRGQRETWAGGTDADLLRRYDRLRTRKDGVAVVAIINGICEGCHVAVPEGRLAELLDDDDRLYTCEGCGRILYAGPR